MANAIQDPMDRLSTIIQGEKSPFVELSERMKETSKDVKNLNMSILDLAIALEERAGVKTDKKDTKEKKEKEPAFRNLGVDLKADLKDFTKGFVSVFTNPFKSIAEGIVGKTEKPTNIENLNTLDIEDTAEKIKPVDNTNIPVENKDITKLDPVQTKDIDKPDLIQNKDTLETDQTKELVDQGQNKVLADMVEVLIDLRDDKSQKQLLGEAIAIKKLITDQSNATKLPGGIEPNNEESKQEDREKLAEAIAIKLSEVMGDIGSNSGLGIPGLDIDKNKKGKSGGKGKVGKFFQGASKFKMPPGIGMAAGGLGTALGVGGLALGAYEASEFLDETDYGGKMAEGAGKEAEKAFKNINADFSKLDITPQQAQDILNQPDSPGKKRDLESFGGEDELRKKAGLIKLDTLSSATTEPAKLFEQASLRKYDYAPETSPKIPAVMPKKEENNVGKLLDQVSDKNTELKMFNMGETQTQTLAPIISQTTVNNTEQTMLAATPTPHSAANSFNKWQGKRSSYTD